MKIPLAPAEFAHLDACLPHATPLSMLDGYLAAVASGPNLILPEQVIQWLGDAGQASDETVASLIIRHYLTVNDALNDQAYAPRTVAVHAWCRGYIAAFSSDMIAWAPLLAAQPDWLKVIISGAEDRPLHDAPEALTAVARSIHGFWVQQRRIGVDSNGLLGQFTALLPRHTDQLNQFH